MTSAHRSPLTAHPSPLTAHPSPLTAHPSPLTSHQVRVRMAPSPTGPLHVGTARTALFNYLFARRHGGAFILRIEDTDPQRNSLESLRTVFDGLQWLGLDWDEGPDPDALSPEAQGSAADYFTTARTLGNRGDYGPYYQSQRAAIYGNYAERLLTADLAYRCFCPRELLAQDKAEQSARGIPSYRYVGRCRHLSDPAQNERAASGEPFAIRLRVPDSGALGWDDLVHGSLEFNCNSQDEDIIVGSSGNPLYNFTVVIDDLTMRITHVLRGDDHISNTPKQILIYRALGAAGPQFGHLPMINGPDGKKLSKRHGPTELTEYGERGVLPEAMLNFLAFLGWSPGEGETQEIFTREELCARFDLAHVNKAAALFNFEKLEWMNAQYLRAKTLADLTDLCLPHLQKAGLVPVELTGEQRSYVESVIALERERMKFPNVAPELTRFCFIEDYEFDEKAVAKWINAKEGQELLADARDNLASLATFDHDAIESVVRSLAGARGVGAAKIIHPLRVALTGRTVGPGLFELMGVLGKERCLQRLARVLPR